MSRLNTEIELKHVIRGFYLSRTTLIKRSHRLYRLEVCRLQLGLLGCDEGAAFGEGLGPHLDAVIPKQGPHELTLLREWGLFASESVDAPLVLLLLRLAGTRSEHAQFQLGNTPLQFLIQRGFR